MFVKENPDRKKKLYMTGDCLAPPTQPTAPSSLTEWVIALHLMCHFLLSDIMDLHMSNLVTLVP